MQKLKFFILSTLLLSSSYVYAKDYKQPKKEYKREHYFKANAMMLGQSQMKVQMLSSTDNLLVSKTKRHRGANGVGLAVGVYGDETWRLELESVFLSGFKLDVPSNNGTFKYHTGAKTATLFGNVYFDFFEYWDFKFYTGLGIGYTRNSMDNLVATGTMNGTNTYFEIKGKTINNIAWNAQFGASTKIANNLYFEGGLRYLHFGKMSSHKRMFAQSPANVALDVRQVTTNKLDGLGIFAGLRYDF